MRDLETVSGHRLISNALWERISETARRLIGSGRSLQDWGADRSHSERIQAAYRCVLDRPPEPEGLAHWESFLARGGSFDGLLRGFVLSAEFRRRLEAHVAAGRSTEAQPGVCELRAGYYCLLGREASAEVQAGWRASVGGGAKLYEMLVAFMRSPEFTQRLGEGRLSTPETGQVEPVVLLLTSEAQESAVQGPAILESVDERLPSGAQVSTTPPRSPSCPWKR